MQPLLLLVLLSLLPLAGCLGTGAACNPPPEADASHAPYDNGVTLYTVRQGTKVDAWACNESGEDRWLLVREGGCPGSWTWTYQRPGADVAEAGWPEETNAAACDAWQKVPSGRAATQSLVLDMLHEAGGEWRIRLQIYTQPELIEDGGGGPVHAVYVL